MKRTSQHGRRQRGGARTSRRLHSEFLEDRRLLSAVPGFLPYLPAQYHLFKSDGYLTAPSADTPIKIAENYLRAHAADVGILPGDLNGYIVTTNYVTKTTGATTLTFEQSFHGLPVDNANFNITVTADGRLLDIGGGFVEGLSQLGNQQPPTPLMNPVQAIVAAADQLGYPLTAQSIEITDGDGEGGDLSYHASDLSLDAIAPVLRYVAVAGANNTSAVSLTWSLTVRTPDNAHWFNADVSGNTGALTALVDYVDDAQYEVEKVPTFDPNDGPRTVVSDPQIFTPTPAIIPSPFGWHDTNGATGAEFTTTNGNNADAYTDRNGDDVPDPGSQPDGGASLNFTGALVPLDLTKSPVDYSNAAVVNLFYLANYAHDVHYLYGFDEAARNFQVNDYGRGGVGGDEVLAEAQDGSGTDNANFATPPDGQSGRMQMFEFDLTTPNRDGDLDAEVVLHEYGHGVSNRLTGNGSGLDALQSGGMGEGWSDWWALMLTQKTANEPDVGRGVGTYVLGEPTTGAGIREFKYQYTITNPQLETFLDFGEGPGHSVEPHDVGTRWTAALWDINKLFIQKYGFEPNLYDSTSSAGNIRALHLIMNALKIQPLNPSFISARDAILEADTLLYGGADQLEIWTAFARRGLGEFASTSSSNSDVITTSFVIPPLSQIAIGGDVTHLEGDSGVTDFVFTVTFTGSPTGINTVTYTTVDGTAKAGSDYQATSGTLTFQPGQLGPQNITVHVFGDTTVESDETFSVVLSNPVGTFLGRTTAVGTILNDDLDLSVSDASVVEGNSGTRDMVFAISAVGRLQQNVTVSYTTTSGTASAGVDFVPRSGTVTFPPTGGVALITVPVIGDTVNEGNEFFTLDLFNALAGHIAKGLGVGTIIDDDRNSALYVNDVHVTASQAGLVNAIFSVALDQASAQFVTVQYTTSDGTAKAAANYLGTSGTISFAPGVTSQLVTVPVLTAGAYAPNEQFYLNLFNPLHAAIVDPLGVGTIIFGPPPPTEAIVDDGDGTYGQTNGWTRFGNTLSYGLDYEMHPAATDGGFADWSFSGLPVGSYQVFTKWIPGANRATNALYTIYDGSTPVGNAQVNQQLMPAGDQSNGVVWQSLGVFNASTGTLDVRLGDNANGNVVADAIRIVSGGIGPQAAEMDVSGVGQSIVDSFIGGAAVPAENNGTDFGIVPAFTNSIIDAFTITNTGNADLHLTGAIPVSLSGANASDFTLMNQPPATIAPGTSATFQIMFHPSVVGMRTAEVTIPSDDAAKGPYTFSIQGTGVDAGPTQLVVDDSGSGYQQQGAWSAHLNSTSSLGQFHSDPGGQGSDWTTWNFANLAPGNYSVYTTYVAAGNRATNAPFTLTDGGTQRTVPVNEQVAPADASYNGVQWKSLGSLALASGRLTVSLSNQANGLVVADAVYLVRNDVPSAGATGTATTNSSSSLANTSTTPSSPNAMHNSVQPLDVNGDGAVSALDALLLIEGLGSAGPSPAGNFLMDVNGDGAVSPVDLLMVIASLRTAGPQSAVAPQATPASVTAGSAAPSATVATAVVAATSAPAAVASPSASPLSASAVDAAFSQMTSTPSFASTTTAAKSAAAVASVPLVKKSSVSSKSGCLLDAQDS